MIWQSVAEAFPALAEIGSQQLWQGVHVLAVGHGGEDVLFHPVAVGQHAFLVTARTEVAGLAGESQQIIVAAAVAIDAGEALMQIDTWPESDGVIAIGLVEMMRKLARQE